MINKFSIAIIGGGASGSLTAIQLLKQLRQPAEVLLIERDESKLFRGAAYSSDLEYEPLNVPVGKMSLYNDRPDDFYNWLRQHVADEEISRDSFVSRRWFGDYIEHQIGEAARQKNAEVTFKVVSSAVVNISRYDEKYFLQLADGKELQAHVVVLATGNEAPADVLPANAARLLGSKYVVNPWEGNALKGINRDEDVLVIGTGLTMADHVISLKQTGHTGKITALSRNGLLPKTHGVSGPYQLQEEIISADFGQLHKNLLTEIENAAAKNTGWISVLDAIRPITPKIWQALTLEAKRTFLEKYRVQWEIHRHRLPRASAEKLQQMLNSLQLEIVQGSVTAVQKARAHFVIHYRHPITGNEQQLKVQRIINCTGPNGNYENSGNALFKTLLQQGWMKKDVLNLGLLTGPRGEVIRRDGSFLPSVFAVGPLRKASEWESTALREIRNQAEQLSGIILDKANCKHPARRSSISAVEVCG